MSFFNSLNYSSSNEDGYSELKALDITQGDNVACITGSGDRALHMLLGDPAHVYAFDMNSAQNYLLELKLAAIKKLQYPDYAGFLGLYSFAAERRIEIYRELKNDLSEDASKFFDKHKRDIKKGVIYSGRWEKYFGFAAKQISFCRKQRVNRLFEFDDVEEQRRFLRDEWDTPAWRTYLKYSFNTVFFRLFFGDPGFYANVPNNLSPGVYIHNRLQNYMENNPAIESFMLALVFKGRFFSEKHYPPYLHQKHFDTLKNKVDRISIHTLSLDKLLLSDIGEKCNKFSLSDVSSFLDKESYRNVFAKFAESPGSRFCMRDFLTDRQAPENCPSNISFKTELQDSLINEDRSIGYTFLIGETA